MAVQCSTAVIHGAGLRRLGLLSAATVLAVLGGCVVAPVDGYDVGAPMVYTDGAYGTPYYYNAPAYGNYYGAPYYYGTPYYGPAVSLGIYGGSNGHWRGNDRWRDNRGWRGDNGWRGNGWRGNGGNWGGKGWSGRPPGGAVPSMPRPPMPPQIRPRPPMPGGGIAPGPGRGFGATGMGIDRRGGTPGNP